MTDALVPAPDLARTVRGRPGAARRPDAPGSASPFPAAPTASLCCCSPPPPGRGRDRSGDRRPPAAAGAAARKPNSSPASAAASACPTRSSPSTVGRGASLQSQARAARYDACSATGPSARNLDAIATGHHVDDQAETLLMRMARGAGLGGLVGVRYKRPLEPGVTLVRPLLDWRRTELAAIVAAAGMTPVDDPANRDPRHDRSRFRGMLADADWADAERLAASRSLAGRCRRGARMGDSRRSLDTRDAQDRRDALIVDAEGLAARAAAPPAAGRLRPLGRAPPARPRAGPGAQGAAGRRSRLPWPASSSTPARRGRCQSPRARRRN